MRCLFPAPFYSIELRGATRQMRNRRETRRGDREDAFWIASLRVGSDLGGEALHRHKRDGAMGSGGLGEPLAG